MSATAKPPVFAAAESAIQRVVRELEARGYRPRRSGRAFSARCPGHDDKNPSLSVSEGSDGRVLIKCHAGCEKQHVVEALGLEMRDLFPARNGTAPRETRYAIRDASGSLVAVHVRRDMLKGKRVHWERGGKKGLDGLPTRALPLYGSELIVNAPEAELVILTEGEKAADELRKHGFLALGTVTGAAGCPDDTPLQVLARRDVVLWPDADQPGHEHMRKIAGKLAGVASRVRVFSWPDAPEAGDAADYFRPAGNGTGETLRAALASAVQADQSIVPPAPAQKLPAVRVDAPPTDLGNAERFAHDHGEHVRFVHASATWFLWDDQRWGQDRDGSVYRLAVKTVRAIYGEAESADERSARERLALHAVKSESQPRLRAMLELVKSMRPIATVPERFDRPETAYLINVENGTLDLRTATLRRHEPSDFITKVAPVEYHPGARSAAWEVFLERQVPDPDVRAFLARAAGATLTGDTGHERMFFVYGPAASGKSTFTEALKAVLGPYAVTCPFETFLRRRGGAGVGDDIARLAGARMVLAGEPDEGRAFDTAVLKKLTGGDVVAARHLYEKHFEFKPQGALWLAGNHRPRANAQDGALWRRVLLVPFERTVDEANRDPAVKACLTRDPEAQQAILAWAVAGALEGQHIGLQPPAAVRVATDAYRAENDDVGRFLAETYDPAPDQVAAKDLRASYTAWCLANGERALPANQLGDVLRAHGLSDGKSGGARCWRWSKPGQGQQDSKDSSTGKAFHSPIPERGFPPTDVPAVLPSVTEARGPSDADRDRREAAILRGLETEP